VLHLLAAYPCLKRSFLSFTFQLSLRCFSLPQKSYLFSSFQSPPLSSAPTPEDLSYSFPSSSPGCFSLPQKLHVSSSFHSPPLSSSQTPDVLSYPFPLGCPSSLPIPTQKDSSNPLPFSSLFPAYLCSKLPF
jgi:hypothetical protein